MNIEWPHNIDCPACLDGGECNCWVKEAEAHVKRLELTNVVLLKASEQMNKWFDVDGYARGVPPRTFVFTMRAAIQQAKEK